MTNDKGQIFTLKLYVWRGCKYHAIFVICIKWLESDLYVLLDAHAEITSHSELESKMQVEAIGFTWSWHQYCAGMVLFSTNKASPNRPALQLFISQSGNQIYGSIFVVLFLQDSQLKLATFYSFILVSWLTSQMMESCD